MSHKKKETGEFERSLDALFIAIISEREGAMNIKDYRLISLARSIYNIISKKFFSRLKKVLDETVLHLRVGSHKC